MSMDWFGAGPEARSLAQLLTMLDREPLEAVLGQSWAREVLQRQAWRRGESAPVPASALEDLFGLVVEARQSPTIAQGPARRHVIIVPDLIPGWSGDRPAVGAPSSQRSACDTLLGGAAALLYGPLRLALRQRAHRVVSELFAYDGLDDLEQAALRLASRLRSVPLPRGSTYLIGHGQGALVVRRALQRLGSGAATAGLAGQILIGPANYGSLAGLWGLIGLTSRLDLAQRFGLEAGASSGPWSRTAWPGRPGLYQLLPFDASRLPGFDAWRVDASLDHTLLAAYHGWARRIDTPSFDAQSRVILGDVRSVRDRTSGPHPEVAGWHRSDGAPDLGGLPGDGEVPHSCAVLPGAITYLAEAAGHAALMVTPEVIAAVLAILEDRPVRLPLVSSDPRDYLPHGRAPRVPPTHGGRLIRMPQSIPSPCAAPPRAAERELNGTFLGRPPARLDPIVEQAKFMTTSVVASGDADWEPNSGISVPQNQSHPRPNHRVDAAPTFGAIPEPHLRREPSVGPRPDHPPQAEGLASFVRGLEPLDSPEPDRAGSATKPTSLVHVADRRAEDRDEPDRIGDWSSTRRRHVIIGSSSLLPFDFLRTGDRLGRAVVKIQRGDGSVGTGFLIAHDIILTNHHVLPDPSTAATAYALANYEAQPARDPSGQPTIVPLDPNQLFVTDADLDFTFCAVEGLDHLGTIPLDRNSLNVLTSECVNIIQHPRGRPKEIALQENRVARVDNLVLQYYCDTEPGSSGSPVFNNRWQLLALHHASVMTDEPEPSPYPDGSGKVRYLNEGIRLSAIALWLETFEVNAGGTRRQREAIARIRAGFRGIDTQAGFFGALGHRVRGRSALEVIAACYDEPVTKANLDLGTWDFREHTGLLDTLIPELGQILADLGMDLWCLVGLSPSQAQALQTQLARTFHLEFQIHHLEARPGTAAITVLAHQRRHIHVRAVAWDATPEDPPESSRLARFRIHLDGPNGPQALDLVPTFGDRTRRDDQGDASELNADPDDPSHVVRTIARQIEASDDPVDWLWINDNTAHDPAPVHRAFRRLAHEVRMVGRDGRTLALLSRPESSLQHLYVAADLGVALGSADRVTLVRDRSLPQTTEELGTDPPILIRIALDTDA